VVQYGRSKAEKGRNIRRNAQALSKAHPAGRSFVRSQEKAFLHARQEQEQYQEECFAPRIQERSI
jgi:hypothetical protein